MIVIDEMFKLKLVYWLRRRYKKNFLNYKVVLKQNFIMSNWNIWFEKLFSSISLEQYFSINKLFSSVSKPIETDLIIYCFVYTSIRIS